MSNKLTWFEVRARYGEGGRKIFHIRLYGDERSASIISRMADASVHLDIKCVDGEPDPSKCGSCEKDLDLCECIP